MKPKFNIFTNLIVLFALVFAVGFKAFDRGEVLAKVGRERVYEYQITDLIQRIPQGQRAQFETPEGKEKLIEVLQSEEHLNVFLISHDFTHPLIDKISIEKNENISSIQ